MKNNQYFWKKMMMIAVVLLLTAGAFTVLRTEASRQAKLDLARDSEKLSVSMRSVKREQIDDEDEEILTEWVEETTTEEKKAETTTEKKAETTTEKKAETTTQKKEETTKKKPETTAEKKTEKKTVKKEEAAAESKDYAFSRQGKKDRTVIVGKSIDLEVNKGKNLKDSHLTWSIKDTSILKFEENDSVGDDVEVIGKKAGKTTVSCYNKKTKETISFTVTVKAKAKTEKKAESTTKEKADTVTEVSKDYTFSRQGSKNRTVKKGKEVELEVKKGRDLKDSHLIWSIKDSSILAFDDNDKTGDDVELKALKAGKTTVSCYNEKTKESIVFQITVEENKSTQESVISKVGNGTIYVELGDDEELEVKVSNVSSKNLKWTINDTSIARFDDNESYGKEVDIEGLKLGETTATCTNLLINKSVSYKIVVVEDDD